MMKSFFVFTLLIAAALCATTKTSSTEPKNDGGLGGALDGVVRTAVGGLGSTVAGATRYVLVPVTGLLGGLLTGLGTILSGPDMPKNTTTTAQKTAPKSG